MLRATLCGVAIVFADTYCYHSRRRSSTYRCRRSTRTTRSIGRTSSSGLWDCVTWWSSTSTTTSSGSSRARTWCRSTWKNDSRNCSNIPPRWTRTPNSSWTATCRSSPWTVKRGHATTRNRSGYRTLFPFTRRSVINPSKRSTPFLTIQAMCFQPSRIGRRRRRASRRFTVTRSEMRCTPPCRLLRLKTAIRIITTSAHHRLWWLSRRRLTTTRPAPKPLRRFDNSLRSCYCCFSSNRTTCYVHI